MMNIKDKYDAIVIGAGIGGLTCGAFLAKEGLSVVTSLCCPQDENPLSYARLKGNSNYHENTNVL